MCQVHCPTLPYIDARRAGLASGSQRAAHSLPICTPPLQVHHIAIGTEITWADYIHESTRCQLPAALNTPSVRHPRQAVDSPGVASSKVSL
jgi:hypothetical protein